MLKPVVFMCVAIISAASSAEGDLDGRLGPEWSGQTPLSEGPGHALYVRHTGDRLLIAIRNDRPSPTLIALRHVDRLSLLLTSHATGTAEYLLTGTDGLLRESFRFAINDPHVSAKFKAHGRADAAPWGVSSPVTGDPRVREFAIDAASAADAQLLIAFHGAGGSVVQLPNPLFDAATVRALLSAEPPARITLIDP